MKTLLTLLVGLALCSGALCLPCPSDNTSPEGDTEVITSASGATFQGLGNLPGAVGFARATAVSEDGSVVVGISRANGGTSGAYQRAFRWEDGGISELPSLAGAITTTPCALSQDGSVVVGECSLQDRVEAFRWTAAEGTLGLGYLTTDDVKSVADDISADGAIIVGVSINEFRTAGTAVRWTAPGSLAGLTGLPGGLVRNRALAVSADGRVIFGYSDNSAVAAGTNPIFRWTAETGATDLGFPARSVEGVPSMAVSADGSTLVGLTSVDGVAQAFRWTQANGLVGLGLLTSADVESMTWAEAVSADGSIVVGVSRRTLPSIPYAELEYAHKAFIWDQPHGLRSLQDVLTGDYGLDLTGWTLTHARDISDDGRTILGDGTNPEGRPQVWIVHLPAPTE